MNNLLKQYRKLVDQDKKIELIDILDQLQDKLNALFGTIYQRFVPLVAIYNEDSTWSIASGDGSHYWHSTDATNPIDTVIFDIPFPALPLDEQYRLKEVNIYYEMANALGTAISVTINRGSNSNHNDYNLSSIGTGTIPVGATTTGKATITCSHNLDSDDNDNKFYITIGDGAGDQSNASDFRLTYIEVVYELRSNFKLK